MKPHPASIQAGISHLRTADPVMRSLIDSVGPCQLRHEPDRFRALVRSILAQQISSKAARSIYGRFLAFLGPKGLSPERLAALPLQHFRSAGISSQKAAYLLDLSQRVKDGQLRLNQLGRLSNDAIIENLVQVKGIGVWTAQMFLIFSLGRLDVFPHGDLGVRAALRALYGLEALPDRETGHKIAEAWRPFATLGSWYCWRSLELTARKDILPSTPSSQATATELPNKNSPRNSPKSATLLPR